jgi:hypothetical protein
MLIDALVHGPGDAREGMISFASPKMRATAVPVTSENDSENIS